MGVVLVFLQSILVGVIVALLTYGLLYVLNRLIGLAIDIEKISLGAGVLAAILSLLRNL